MYKKHVHAVYRYALAVLHNEADAEDVTQQTFLSAYRAFERGERPHTPHNWLIKIAHNVCRQRFRDSSRRPQEVEFDESLAAAAAEDPDVPTATEIRRALGFLAFNQRAALVMRELEGRSYAEIAQILDTSVGAVETLIFRARRALREQLEGGLTCQEAKVTLSRLEENELPSAERGALRAHLRECKDCATLERRQRAQSAALRHLGGVPLPASLAGSFFGGGTTGGIAIGGGLGLGAKMASVVAAGLVVAGVGHEAVKAVAAKDKKPTRSPAVEQKRTSSSQVSGRTQQGAKSGPSATGDRRHAKRGASARNLRSAAHANARKLGAGQGSGSASGGEGNGSGSGSGSGSGQGSGSGSGSRIGRRRCRCAFHRRRFTYSFPPCRQSLCRRCRPAAAAASAAASAPAAAASAASSTAAAAAAAATAVALRRKKRRCAASM